MFDQWYQSKTREAAKNCWFGAIALIPATIIAATITWWAIWVVLTISIGTLFEASSQVVSICSWVTLGIIFAWQFARGQHHQDEYKFSGRPLSVTEVAAIRMTGETFLTFVFDPAAGGAFISFIAAWFLTAPRLASLAIVLHERAKRLGSASNATYQGAMQDLLGSKESVSLAELADRNEIDQPLEMLRTLTAIDGVVALTQHDLALTVAPRLAKEYEDSILANV